MSYELVPFIAGASLAGWRSSGRSLAIASLCIGSVCAAFAGELAWPAPMASLAIAVDALSTAAGCIITQQVIRLATRLHGRE
jgi:hypothetical protein